MFGYVRPDASRLLVREYRFYRCVYCGLCKELSKKNRLLPFTLSYDFVFLSVLRLSLSGDDVQLKKGRCIAHPLRREKYLASTPQLDYSARAAAYLLYKNLEDDVSDKRGFKKLFAKLGVPTARRIARNHPVSKELSYEIDRELSVISSREKESAAGIYDCAEPFGLLLGAVFAEGFDDPMLARPLTELGRHVGRWIYLTDALDDLKKDEKSGSYNPFLLSGESEKEDFKEHALFALDMELSDACRALDLLPISDEGLLHILNNVLREGMPAVSREILYPEAKKDAEDNVRFGRIR